MKTEILAILDRSGSMANLIPETIGGFNRFLAEQKAVVGEAKMSLVLFDDIYQLVYAGQDVQSAPELNKDTYTTRGMTALFDGIGKTMNVQGERIKSEAWAEKVIVLIITDGGENASHEFKIDKIKEIIKHAEGHGWSFIFMGANQDAFAVGSSFGNAAGSNITYKASASGTHAAYSTASASTTSLRGGFVDPNAGKAGLDAEDLLKKAAPTL